MFEVSVTEESKLYTFSNSAIVISGISVSEVFRAARVTAKTIQSDSCTVLAESQLPFVNRCENCAIPMLR
jgi:hypothetical protein